MTTRTGALAVVIGRAGSKGLPGKNALVIAGRPMVVHTLEAALDARSVGRVIVSTDDESVAAAARAIQVPVVRRPDELATDDAPVDAAVRHAVESIQATEEIVVILYANVPVRPPGLIDRAVGRLLETGADSVQSYAGVGKHHPEWMVTLDEHARVRPHTERTIHRRQDLPKMLIPDGGVIAVTRRSLFAGSAADPHAFLGADRRGIEVPSGSVVDIDGPLDLVVAEALLTRGAQRSECRPGRPPNASHVPGGAADRIGRGAQRSECRPGGPYGALETNIDPDGRPYIIAELGVNHDGSPARAMELVEAARAAGADAVKVQWFEAARLLSRAARLAPYQQRPGGPATAGQLLRALELTPSQIGAVVERAHDLGLHAIVTLFSLEHIAEASALSWDAFKTASPDVINRPLIEALMALGTTLLVSTGAASLREIEAVTEWLGDHPHVLMHCVSAYPTPDDSAALAGRLALCRINPRALGYSDHTTAVDTGALAVAGGACVLEKHLTYDRGAAGPDHAVSLDPEGFREYVRLAHRAARMRGAARKEILDIEREVRAVARQSLTAARDLPAGHVLDRGDLTIKRPGTGIPPARLEVTLGRRLAEPIEADLPLTEEHLA